MTYDLDSIEARKRFDRALRILRETFEHDDYVLPVPEGKLLPELMENELEFYKRYIE